LGRIRHPRDELATLDDARTLPGLMSPTRGHPFFGRLADPLRAHASGLSPVAALAEPLRWCLQVDGQEWAEAQRATRRCVRRRAVLSRWRRSDAVRLFDYLCWVLALFLVRLLVSGDPRWWLAIGGRDRFGMLFEIHMVCLPRHVRV